MGKQLIYNDIFLSFIGITPVTGKQLNTQNQPEYNPWNNPHNGETILFWLIDSMMILE